MINLKEWTGCDIEVRIKGGKKLRAVYYPKGNGFHTKADPFINIHIPKYIQFPYKMYWSHGLKRIPVPPTFQSKDELLVYILGHEIMHHWQTFNKRGSSEVQAEFNAHAFLDYFRKSESPLRPQAI